MLLTKVLLILQKRINELRNLSFTKTNICLNILMYCITKKNVLIICQHWILFPTRFKKLYLVARVRLFDYYLLWKYTSFINPYISTQTFVFIFKVLTCNSLNHKISFNEEWWTFKPNIVLFWRDHLSNDLTE